MTAGRPSPSRLDAPGRVPDRRGLELGVSSGRRARRSTRAQGKPPGGPPAGAGVLLLAVVFVLGAVVVLPLFTRDADRDDAAIGPTSSAVSPPSATLAAAVPDEPDQPANATPPGSTLVDLPGPTVFQPPWTTTVSLVTPRPTVAPTPRATAPPTPRPTPPPTPLPTAEPTQRPPAERVRVRLSDELFVGDYDGRGSGSYDGRTVSWVYGQGTPYHTMTADFRLPRRGDLGRRASLVIVGIDGGDEGKSRIAIVLNGVTVYEGRNPLPNDQGGDDSEPIEWGRAVFRVPGEILRRNNTISVSNLEAAACTLCPTFVMLDYAVLEYRIRPPE